MQSVSTRLQTLNDHIDFFADEFGQPIKFRIQPGFNSALRTRLEDGITSHGGLVITRIPVRGIVVVDPRSRSGRDIVSQWAWKEREARHFVSYTYVQQCLDAKEMLSLAEHALQPEAYKQNAYRFSKGQLNLSSDVKDKLALYLATIAPELASGSRPSNRLFQRLVKNKHRYPWVGNHDWQTLKNCYYKNKKYSDKLISAIIDERGQKAKAIVFPQREFLIEKVVDGDTKAPVVEAVIPSRKKHALENIDPSTSTSKKVKFNKEVLGELKRNFAVDVTNTATKTRAMRNLRTIDDMLKEPLPRILRKRDVEQRKAAIVTALRDNDVAEVEVSRALLDKPHVGVWVDDKFNNNGSLERDLMLGKDESHDSFTSQNLSRFQLSLASYGMDLDDLRSSMRLDASNYDSEADLVDEHSVVELLGLSNIAAANPVPRQTDNAIIKTATNTSLHQSSARSSAHNHEDPESIAIRQLVHTTHFTQEEIEQKLASFSGDMVKTRSFFERCRLFIDDLFAQSLKADAGVDISNNTYATRSTVPTEDAGANAHAHPRVQITKQRTYGRWGRRWSSKS